MNYEENREKIRNMLFKINTSFEGKEEIYQKTIDYIMKVGEQCYKEAIHNMKDTYDNTIDWDYRDTEWGLKENGIIKP